MGDAPCFVWRPIPPNKNFVALGMIANTSGDEPKVTECRCVPKGWTVPSRVKPKKVWDDQVMLTFQRLN